MHYIGILFGSDESLLDKYYEGLEVDLHIESSKEDKIKEYIDARNRAIAWHKNKVKENDNFSYHQKWLNEHKKFTKKTAWEKIKKDYEGYIDDDENILSNYNPDAQWDWYVIGGRWSRYLPLKEKDESGEPIWVDEALISEIDWKKFKEIRKFPYCFITDSGDWHSHGDIGWFSSFNNKSDSIWQKEFFDEIKKYPLDTPIMAIDFHI